MHCPNCGRELMEGEICTCTSTAYNNPTVISTPTPEGYQPQQQYYAPQQQQYYDPNQAQQQYYNPAVQQITPSTDYPEGYAPKKKYIALILAVTLGIFGIHNFYLGNNSKALAQLLIAIIGSLLFGLGPAVVTVWVAIEIVQILTDKINADSNNYKLMTFAEELAKQINK